MFTQIQLLILSLVFLSSMSTNWVFADEISVIPVGDAVQLGCHETDLGCFTSNQFNAKVGDKIIFHNPHDEFHYFNSGNLNMGPTQIFNTGIIYPGDTFTWIPQSAIVTDFFCMIHPWMSGKISVEPSDLTDTEDNQVCPSDQVLINGVCTPISQDIVLHEKIQNQEGLIKEKNDKIKSELEDLLVKDTKDKDKVTICHIPPGNPDNAHSITIDSSALPAHLAHNDELGYCDSSEFVKLRNDEVKLIEKESEINDKIKSKYRQLTNNPEHENILESLIVNLQEKNSILDQRIDVIEQKKKIIDDKVTICHIPPENPDNAHTISIDSSALNTHLSHGDYEDECKPISSTSVKDSFRFNSQKMLALFSELEQIPEENKKLSEITPYRLLEKYDIPFEIAQKITVDKKSVNQKVAICHIPPGNIQNPRSIAIDESSLQTHLSHGDIQGKCAPIKTMYDGYLQWYKEDFPLEIIIPQNERNPQIPKKILDTITKVYDKIPKNETPLTNLLNSDELENFDLTNEEAGKIIISKEKVSDKESVCHIPPGNPNNPFTIQIHTSALTTHLNHGDSKGSCQSNEPMEPIYIVVVKWYKESVPYVVIIPEKDEELDLTDEPFKILDVIPKISDDLPLEPTNLIEIIDYKILESTVYEFLEDSSNDESDDPTTPSSDDKTTESTIEPKVIREIIEKIIIQKEFNTEYSALEEFDDKTDQQITDEYIPTVPTVYLVDVEYRDDSEIQNMSFQQIESIQFEYNNELMSPLEFDQSQEIFDMIVDEGIKISFEKDSLSQLVSVDTASDYSISLDLSDITLEKNSKWELLTSSVESEEQSSTPMSFQMPSIPIELVYAIGIIGLIIFFIILFLILKPKQVSLAIIGGYTGLGTKNMHPYLILASYDSKNEQFSSVGCIHTELPDDEWKEVSKDIHSRELLEIPKNFVFFEKHIPVEIKNQNPVWVKPEYYIKAKVQNLTTLPIWAKKNTESELNYNVYLKGDKIKFKKLDSIDSITINAKLDKMHKKHFKKKFTTLENNPNTQN